MLTPTPTSFYLLAEITHRNHRPYPYLITISLVGDTIKPICSSKVCNTPDQIEAYLNDNTELKSYRDLGIPFRTKYFKEYLTTTSTTKRSCYEQE